MKEIVLKAIIGFEYAMSGLNIDYVITDVIEDESEGAALYLFASEDCGIESSAFAYRDGDVLILSDWQGPRPERLTEVDDYEWIHISGRKAINVNKYPRLFM